MGYTPWSIMAETVSEKPWTSGRPCTEISMVGFFECPRPLAHGHGPGDAALHGPAIQPAREHHRSGVDTQRPSPRARACSGKGKAPRLSPLDGHLLCKEESTVRTGHAESEPVTGLHTKDFDPQDQGWRGRYELLITPAAMD